MKRRKKFRSTRLAELWKVILAKFCKPEFTVLLFPVLLQTPRINDLWSHNLILHYMKALKIANKEFSSRLFLGTGKFGSSAQMEEAVLASGSELVTVALKRIDLETDTDSLLSHLQHPHIHLLPNTSGARNAIEAIFAAQLAREALETNWLKLEIHPDPKYLLPDPIETLKACEELARLGFVILPYIHADPVLCKRLEDAGTAAVMPLGSPIGTNKGLRTIDFL